MKLHNKFGSAFDFRWWVSASLLLALLLSVWTLSLTVTNNEAHNNSARQAAEMVNALVQLELAVRNLAMAASAAEPTVFDVDWQSVYRTHRDRAEQLMARDSYVNTIRETLTRSDAFVSNLVALQSESVEAASDPARAALLQQQFLTTRDRLADQLRQSQQAVRSHYSLVVQEMSTDWRNLRFLVATTCLLVFAVICLFRVYRMDRIHREHVQQELERNNSKLEAALMETREASAVRMRILNNVSHEVRTPMNGVLEATDLLLETDLSREQRELGETIQVSGQCLLSEIDGMLDFSKLNDGEVELETVAFSLRQLLDGLLSEEAQAAAQKGLDLNFLVEKTVPDAVRGDPARLKQVLENLTANATKFTEHGEVGVRVSLVEASDDEAAVRFDVTDTGIGIPKEALPRIFEPFSQADMTISRKFGGLGLGLAITRTIVEKMGGEIGADSTVGSGSKFWFTIPLGRQRIGIPSVAPRSSTPS